MAPTSDWIDRSGTFDPSSMLVLRPINALQPTSQKLAVQHTYAKLSLPTAALFAASGDLIERAAHDSGVARQLIDDLQQLVSGGAVGRGDVDGGFEFYLPRTSTVLDARELYDFLPKVHEEVRARAEGQQWRVLFHRFIPSRASAWAYAVPRLRRVRIDGLWGVPDGLDWGPHDTFEVDSDTGNVLRKTIRFKDIYLDVKADGDWAPKTADEPWDWKPSVTPPQLATIARGTQALADHEGQPVNLMWFVGVRPSSGHPDCIPWVHHTNPAGADFNPAPAHKPVAVIHTRDDLQKVSEAAKMGEFRPGSYVEVVPREALIRDKEFVAALTDVSSKYNLVVVIDGSPLSHSYYVLRRDGAGVVCRDVMPDASGPTQHFSKLVRDLVPRLIESRGERAVTLRVPPEYAFRLMKQKLVEEALEVLNAQGQNDTLSELADVLEVVSSLAQQAGEDLAGVSERAGVKRQSRGGFDSRVVLLRTQALSMDDARMQASSGTAGQDLDRESESPWLDLPPIEYRTSQALSGQLPTVVTGRTIEIPLVPPAPVGRSASYRLDLGHDAEVVTVRYAGSVVNVYLGEPSAESTEDQLKFSFDAE
jgi:predicted house-cleaning noncanonical NTP pyrophosphatase (MazG superfamily)